MMIELSVLTYLSIALIITNILLASILIFIERKDAQSTWAWLLILFFIPFFGFIIYFLLGQTLSRRKLFKWSGIKKMGLEDMIQRQQDDVRSPHFHFGNETANQHRDLIYMHLMNNEAVLTENNTVDILNDGKMKFQQLLTDIRAAKTFIHIQYYIFRYDGIGKEVIDALTARAAAGVKVRLLYDELGSRSLRKKFLRSFLEAGGEVGVFFPSKFAIINFRLNFRNHRKLVNIDGKIGYIGGFNVGDEYLGKKKRFGYWRDTHLRIQGPAVQAIQTRFILDWNQAAKEYYISYHDRYFPPCTSSGNVPLQIVSSGPDSESEQIKNGYLKMIMSAKKSIFIQTPYFIPDQTLLDALRVAAQTGIDVEIMIPNKPDHMFVYWATTSHIGEMLKVGATVYIYEGGFIHNKVIIIDETLSTVGTANIDQRSFKLNFEVNAFIYDKATARRLSADFRADVETSSLLTLSDYEHRPKRTRFKESISRLLSPIL
ncbi:cardiolipin synthase [Bacillus sp. FSL W7-1360]